MKSDFDEVCEKVLDRERRQKVFTANFNNFKILKTIANVVNANKEDNNLRKNNKGRRSGDGDKPICKEYKGSHTNYWLAYSK